MAYTAVSRLTSLSGLHFIAFDPAQIRTSQKVIDEYSRLSKLSPFVVRQPGTHDVPSPQSHFVSPIPSSPIVLPNVQNSPIILDHLGRHRSKFLHSSPPSLFTPSPQASTTQPPLKRHLPFSPLPNIVEKHFKCHVPSPPPALSPHSKAPFNKRSVHDSPSPLLNPPSSKRTKTYFSPNLVTFNSPVRNPHNASNSTQRPPNSFPQVVSELLGRAYVIDFLAHSQSAETATLLQSLGFAVNTAFDNIQVQSSCGYIAARVVSKLNALISAQQSWFDASLCDCNYFGPVAFDHDICALGNYALDIPGTGPIFLSETNCLDLIPIYSLHFHDYLLQSRDDYLTNVECHSKSTFKARLIHLWDKFKSSGQVLSPTLFIVNTHDGHGLHWYTVALEISGPSGSAHEL